MRGIVYIDGFFWPAEEAKISVFDHGFLYGDGLFETMRTYKGKVFQIEEHLKRLYNSADIMELTIPISASNLKEAVDRTIEKNKLDTEAYIRITITRGKGSVGINPKLCTEASVVIMVKEIKINPQVQLAGVEAIIVKTRRNAIDATDPRIKTMNFLNNIFAKMEVEKAGVMEGIMLNAQEEVTEATVSNIFLVKEGILKTPPVSSGILPGITRGVVLQIFAKYGEVREVTILPEDIFTAEEIFLTNSISGIIPVTKVNNKKIGQGTIGRITEEIMRAYQCANSL